MVTLLVPHEEFIHGSKGFPLKYGGLLTFQTSKSIDDSEPVRLSDPIIRAIMAACEGTAEFFEVTFIGHGTTLDYYLIGDALTPLEAAILRDRVIKAVTHILLAFQKDLKISQIKFKKIG